MKTHNNLLLAEAKTRIGTMNLTQTEIYIDKLMESEEFNDPANTSYETAKQSLIAACERSLSLKGIDPVSGLPRGHESLTDAEALEATLRRKGNDEDADLVRDGIIASKEKGEKDHAEAKAAADKVDEHIAKENESRQTTEIERAATRSRQEYDAFIKLGMDPHEASYMAGWAPPDLDPQRSAEDILADE